MPEPLSPWLLLVLGMAVAVLGIVTLRQNAFVALIAAALLVAGLSPLEGVDAITRVGAAFGEAAGKIGPVIAFAAVIGQAMTESGSAARLAQALVVALGERRASVGLLTSGYVLSIPVFFDTVFYLLLPIARSRGRRSPKDYLRSVLAIAAGAAITHTLVPPTPGPLAMAASLHVDLGSLMLLGLLVSLVAALVALKCLPWLERLVGSSSEEIAAFALAGAPTPDGSLSSSGADAEPPPPMGEVRTPAPPLWLAAAPIVLPVAMIGAGTAWGALAKEPPPAWLHWLSHPTIALAVSMAVALLTAKRVARLGRDALAASSETALRDAALIILITAAGAAFGASLKDAGVGAAVTSLMGTQAAGAALMLVGFLLASLLKLAQGSSTAAMVVTSGMLGSSVGVEQLPFHPAYLCMAIGGGSLVGSWMNDSGFWICTRLFRFPRYVGSCWKVWLGLYTSNYQ